MLGIEPKTITSGTVHNEITDDDTRIDNLYPTFLLSRVNQPEVTVDCWWDVVVSPLLLMLPCARFLLVS